ncbi:MAG: hypothetical protein NUV53_03430 [Patescibacteria group bacterium]|nr:hypothetical protein [Patescibacteria group bacterium]
MQENKTAWIIAVVAIVVAGGIAWWYVSGMNPQTMEKNPVSATQPVPESSNAEGGVVVETPASVSEDLDSLQNELDAVNFGDADFQRDINTLDSDIQNGF